MASIFSRIISGEIPCHKVGENQDCIAFLDISPLAVGHVLVVPKTEVDYLFDLDDPLYLRLVSFAKQVAKAQRQVIPCQRIGVCVIGLEVPHAHIHLIPMNSVSDMNFSRPKLQLSAELMADTASKIAAALSGQA
jgi:histidine triad (HIT) family protein